MVSNHISCGDTRNEDDFVSHIKEVVESSLSASRWHFVADNLNIHKSESLVRYVAEVSDMDIDLGIKDKSGILQSIETRESFLINPLRTQNNEEPKMLNSRLIFCWYYYRNEHPSHPPQNIYFRYLDIRQKDILAYSFVLKS